MGILLVEDDLEISSFVLLRGAPYCSHVDEPSGDNEN
jgi:hypothetical protein